MHLALFGLSLFWTRYIDTPVRFRLSDKLNCARLYFLFIMASIGGIALLWHKWKCKCKSWTWFFCVVFISLHAHFNILNCNEYCAKKTKVQVLHIYIFRYVKVKHCYQHSWSYNQAFLGRSIGSLFFWYVLFIA